MSHVVWRMTFADKLKKWRKSKSLSQEEAAEHLGVPTGTLQGWEQGRHQPTDLAMETILRILNRFPITIEERKKYNNKEIELRKLPFRGSLRARREQGYWSRPTEQRGPQKYTLMNGMVTTPASKLLSSTSLKKHFAASRR